MRTDVRVRKLLLDRHNSLSVHAEQKYALYTYKTFLNPVILLQKVQAYAGPNCICSVFYYDKIVGPQFFVFFFFF